MSVLNFKEGQVYSFIDEQVCQEFINLGVAEGDERLAEFVGLEPFEVYKMEDGEVLSVKNLAGAILTFEDLDQSYLLGSGDSLYFKADKADPEVVYAKIKAYIASLAGVDFLAALNSKDALNPIYQTCYEFFPNNDVGDE